MRVTARRFLLMAVAVVPLAACGGLAPSPDSTGVYDNPALALSVDQQLAQSTGEAARALQTLASVSRSRHDVAPPLDESGLPPELRVKVNEANWSGPGDQLTRDLAANVGYSYSTEGAPPASPPFVFVNIDNESAARAFEDVGLQVQQFATVLVDPNTRHVTFRYDTANPHVDLPPPARSAHVRRGPVHHRAHHAAPAVTPASGS